MLSRANESCVTDGASDSVHASAWVGSVESADCCQLVEGTAVDHVGTGEGACAECLHHCVTSESGRDLDC